MTDDPGYIKSRTTSVPTRRSSDLGVNLGLEAGVMISLKVGGSSITIGPAGVTLDGPLVRINCGGSPLAAMKGEKPDKAKKAGEAIAGKAGKISNPGQQRSEKQTSALQSRMRNSYAVVSLNKKTTIQ